jgi:hypothetical protein
LLVKWFKEQPAGAGMNWESTAPAGTDEKSEAYLALKLDIAWTSDAEV